ncbi:MAG: M20/M25/M40 family metallo-hydrolase [Bdellovibrionales bacterium]|nr:M20/M25/M40 family metallo-hydrolase [Bdellovibrionales bacterium]
MIRIFAILTPFLFIPLLASAQHQHDFAGLETPETMSAMRLIDRGDGSAPRWMTFADAMKLSEKSHAEGRCAGFMDITDFQDLDQEPMPMVEYFKLNLGDRPLKQQAYLSRAINELDSQQLFKTVSEMSAFKNRYYKSDLGVQAAIYISDRFKAIAKNRTDIEVNLFKHNWPQPSVVAVMKGQGPHANEIVILGGHEDSINQSAFGSNNMTAPGADDNASGTATVIEVFREIVESGFKPDRTLMFMTYAAEEVGLYGSQDIAKKFKEQGKTVVGVMQLDMTAFPGAGDQIVFMTDFTNPNLTQFAQKLVDSYVKVKWSTDKCGYACSDHASWTKAGYAAIMPFEATMKNDNKDIHTVRDVIQKLDFKFGLHFAKLGLAFLTELAKD